MPLKPGISPNRFLGTVTSASTGLFNDRRLALSAYSADTSLIMHFSKKLLAAITAALPEWALFFVDYKQLKKVTKAVGAGAIAAEEFWKSLEEEKIKVRRFYCDKHAWAQAFIMELTARVEQLSMMTAESGFDREDVAEYVHALVAKARRQASASTDDDASSDDDEEVDDEAESARNDLARSTAGAALPMSAASAAASYSSAVESSDAATTASTEAAESKADSDSSSDGIPTLHGKGSTARSAQARAVEIEEHRAAYVGAKKGLQDFRRELTLVQRFVELNAEAVRKIVKKFSKVAGTDEERDAYMAKQDEDADFAFFEGKELEELVAQVDALLAKTVTTKPINSNWQHTRVYTVGCFDLAHRGHENLFRALREYGRNLVVGLHDDASYFKLKGKHTIDNLEKRIENIKPFCDQVFVIPSTDPTPFLRAMVSDQDVKDGSCCYVRGADMPQFPGRSYIESVMPVHLLPRSEGVSSSLVRAIYHSAAEDDADMVQAKAMAAAFAPQDAAGKPLVTDELIEAELEKLQRKNELAAIARASKEAAAAELDETEPAPAIPPLA